MIRPATIADIPALNSLGKMFLESTILSSIAPYDETSMAETLYKWIKGDCFGVLVQVLDGEVVGGISGMILPLYWNKAVLVAQQFTWFVHPEHRGIGSLKLLAAWEKWAAERGAVAFFSGAKKDRRFEGMDRVLARSGYVDLESVHVKGVKPCQSPE